MTRNEMLNILNNLPYTLIWPGNWDDILGTERELWINNLGYGYIYCDEPTAHWAGELQLDKNKWEDIKTKIEKRVLTFDDIKETGLENLLNGLSYNEYDFENCADLINDLSNLLFLENGPFGKIYALQTFETVMYFNSESLFKREFEKDWADEYWNDMDDELLKTWINRLKNENNSELQEWKNKYNLNK